MAEAYTTRKAIARFLPNVKKGFLLIVFEVPDLQPALLSKKKAKNAEAEIRIPDEPGEFGKVKLKGGVDFLLEATSDHFGSLRTKWASGESYYEIVKDEVHVYLKDA